MVIKDSENQLCVPLCDHDLDRAPVILHRHDGWDLNGEDQRPSEVSVQLDYVSESALIVLSWERGFETRVL